MNFASGTDRRIAGNVERIPGWADELRGGAQRVRAGARWRRKGIDPPPFAAPVQIAEQERYSVCHRNRKGGVVVKFCSIAAAYAALPGIRAAMQDNIR